MKLAAIDIGTNAARLLIAQVEQVAGQVQFQKLAYYRVPLRLGEDVFDKGKISAKKAVQFEQTIHAFQLLASAHNVSQLRAVATSAMREASNAKKIAKQILFPEMEHGIKFDNGLNYEDKIKVLLNNHLVTKSNNLTLMLNKYESIIQKNIPGYRTSIFLKDSDLIFPITMELEENILTPNTDLYLLAKNSNPDLKVMAFSDRVDKIIQEKYSEKNNEIISLGCISIISLGLGIISGVAIFAK